MTVYQPGEPVTYINSVGTRLPARVVSETNNSSESCRVYWIQIEGSRPGYYPGDLPATNSDLEPRICTPQGDSTLGES